ncbi:MAG: hypothetical protein AB1Z98_24490 [Nannocystaceae bacterium]
MRLCSLVPLGFLLIALALPGCTVDPGDNNPFGTATPVTSAPPSNDTGDEDGTATSGSDTAGATGGSGPQDGTTDGGDSTGPAVTTGPMMTTTGVTAGGSTDDGGGNGMQPANGMYSSCLVAGDCDFLCITLTDDLGAVLGGFCSDFPCINPAIDCDPSPGGTAIPSCIGIEINMVPDTACYLDCTGGLSCPSPMVCEPVVGGLSICV